MIQSKQLKRSISYRFYNEYGHFIRVTFPVGRIQAFLRCDTCRDDQLCHRSVWTVGDTEQGCIDYARKNFGWLVENGRVQCPTARGAITERPPEGMEEQP